jgi:hypothetical protein
MDMVYAADTANIMMPDGSMVLIREGQPWSPNDPVVQFKPMLFRRDPEAQAPTSIGADGQPVVEQATAAPGEKRNTRR